MPRLAKAPFKPKKYDLWRSLDLGLDEHPNTGNTTDLKPGQLPDKPRTIAGQSYDSPRTITGQLPDKPQTNYRTSPMTVLGQLPDNYRTTQKYPFNIMSGFKRKITVFIYECCNQNQSNQTHPIAGKEIASLCNSTIDSVQRIIYRLVEDGVITRIQSQSGPGGWTIYGLPETVHRQIQESELRDNYRTITGQLPDKPQTNYRTNSQTIAPSSSSSHMDLKTTTTELPAEWKEILIPSKVGGMGFEEELLPGIYKNSGLNAQTIQNALWYCEWDIEHNNFIEKSTTSGLARLLDCISKRKEPYPKPKGFISQREGAIAEELANQKAENERILIMVHEAKVIKFENFKASLTSEAKAMVLSKYLTLDEISRKLTEEEEEALLKKHFDTEIYKEKS